MFITEVGSLIVVIEEMEKTFLEKNNDLLVFDTRDNVDTSAGETVRKAEALVVKWYNNFVKERLTECTCLLQKCCPKTS